MVTTIQSSSTYFAVFIDSPKLVELKHISENATHLHAHVNVSVRGGNQVLAEVQLPNNLKPDIDNCYRDGEKY